jgi:hypothetical protein
MATQSQASHQSSSAMRLYGPAARSSVVQDLSPQRVLAAELRLDRAIPSGSERESGLRLALSLRAEHKPALARRQSEKEPRFARTGTATWSVTTRSNSSCFEPK